MTSSHRILQQDAYVLHSYPYRETSLLLELITRQHGRFGAIAKGVRSQRSRNRVLLQPFQPLILSWSGRGELPTLTAIETRAPAYRFSGNRLMSAFYVNELMLKLLHRHDPHEELFVAYEQVLGNCSESIKPDDLQAESCLRIFEKRLMEELGYGLSFIDSESEGGVIDDAGSYSYIPMHGVVPAAAGHPSFSGRTLKAIAQENFIDKQVLREAKQLMKTVIDYHLGNTMLNTRHTLLSMQSLMKNVCTEGGDIK
jgi:DNA repair protein RecO (recombination protein O)